MLIALAIVLASAFFGATFAGLGYGLARLHLRSLALVNDAWQTATLTTTEAARDIIGAANDVVNGPRQQVTEVVEPRRPDAGETWYEHDVERVPDPTDHLIPDTDLTRVSASIVKGSPLAMLRGGASIPNLHGEDIA